MFGSNLELPADVILNQLVQEFVVLLEQHIVKANPRANEHLLHALYRAQPPQKRDIIGMVGVDVFTRRGRKALSALAKSVLLLFIAGRVTEICGWTANIVNVALEIRLFREHNRLVVHGVLASRLNLSSLMKRD